MSTIAGYLGPVASFSHQAALAVFPEDDESSAPVQLKPLPTFTEIFKALQSQEIGFGVIPIENSSNGSVIQTLDLLSDRASQYANIRIVGEYYLPVHHFLLARKPSGDAASESTGTHDRIVKVRKLYTHPQAWGQCEGFLSQHLKGVERQDVSSTSKAAVIVAHEQPNISDGTFSAAIASDLAAKVNELDILAPNIEDSASNVTRFLVFARSDISQSSLSQIHQRVRRARQSPNNASALAGGIRHSLPQSQSQSQCKSKSLLSFTVPHSHPGSLATALEVFKSHSLNLTSIDTRPSRQRRWHYIFFVECETEGDDKKQNTSVEENGDGKSNGNGNFTANDNDIEERIKRLVWDLDKVAERSRVWGWWEDQSFVSVPASASVHRNS